MMDDKSLAMGCRVDLWAASRLETRCCMRCLAGSCQLHSWNTKPWLLRELASTTMPLRESPDTP